jgi:hypothetical protein
VADCDQAAALDPQFVKVQTRKGRALLKLGQINEASDSFSYVLSWQPKESEATKDDSDRFGKDLARQAMKQVVLAKTLRERLLSGSCGNNKQILQTAEELLSLCPYMRLVCLLLLIPPSPEAHVAPAPVGTNLQSPSSLPNEEMVRGQNIYGTLRLFDP